MTTRSLLLLMVQTSLLSSWVHPAHADCPPGEITVTVINMVPYIRSDESFQDSEPSLAVNFADPFKLVGTAFTPAPMGNNAPIYFSLDGGASWTLNPILIGNEPLSGTNDISVTFGGMSGHLYAASLEANTNAKMNILFTPDFTGSSIMQSLMPREQTDQPRLVAITAWEGPSQGSDLVYVTSKDLSAEGEWHTSTLDQSDGTPLPGTAKFYPPLRLEEGANCGEDGVAVISAPQLSGRVYAAFIRWKSPCNGNPHNADLIVLRDDNWGVGSDVFTALKDGSTRGIIAIANFWESSESISYQRIRSNLAIAASPKNDKVVFLAWGQGESADAYELHLASSIDKGEHWTPSALTFSHATNPALAVNIHGVVGFLYQQHVERSGNKYWETHFVTSQDNLVSCSSDDVLASVPDPGVGFTAPAPLGDYLQLTAVGKNFYGVFSSRNEPNSAHFPLGVTYQRSVNWGTQKLVKLGKDPWSTNPDDFVPVSADPFFFKAQTIPPEKDFYVRDWTLSPLLADPGLEPSSQRAFYTTSDVWNRRSDDPGPFIDDQPQNETPVSGPGTQGDNWAFARIRRNALSASGSTTVTAHFLVSKFGTGSNFVDAVSSDPDVTFPAPADDTITFAANELGPVLTPPFPWHLNVTGSHHLCLAVEISTTPDDPYVSPSLSGNTPGWYSEEHTDLRVMYDNNRAQRNMQVLYISMMAQQSTQSSACAIVHNGAVFRRDITLRCEAPPHVVRALPKTSIEVIGERTRLFRPGSSIVLRNMEPGENRWIVFTSSKPAEATTPDAPGRTGDSVFPVYFYEMLGQNAMNGFAIGVQAVPSEGLYPENLRFHAALFSRLPSGRPSSVLLPPDRGISPAAYLQFLRGFLDEWNSMAPRLLDSLGFGDPFQLRDTSKDLAKAVDRNDAASSSTLHGAFLNRLDSYITMVELSKGDPADILQNVRWQGEVFQKDPSLQAIACRDSILTLSAAFIRDYSKRVIGTPDYADHIRAVLPCLRSVAANAGRHRNPLLEACERMQRNLADPRALQRAHRDYLLELEELR